MQAKTETVKVRIKPGAAVFQDRYFGQWPVLRCDRADPDTLFDAEWNGSRWECRADGYGYHRSDGDDGEYGNGSLFVLGRDGVEPVSGG